MAVASRFPDVEIPDQTLPQFVLDGAVVCGDQTAVVDGAGGWVGVDLPGSLGRAGADR